MALDSRMCIQDHGKHLNEWNFSSEKLTTFLLSFSSGDKQFGFFSEVTLQSLIKLMQLREEQTFPLFVLVYWHAK